MFDFNSFFCQIFGMIVIAIILIYNTGDIKK